MVVLGMRYVVRVFTKAGFNWTVRETGHASEDEARQAAFWLGQNADGMVALATDVDGANRRVLCQTGKLPPEYEI